MFNGASNKFFFLKAVYVKMSLIKKSNKLQDICYDIRGPALREAKRLEEEGFNIIKLNIGNPAIFGLNAPEEIVHDYIINLPGADGYCDSKGLFSARKAVMHETQLRKIPGVTIDDIYMGNGISELIVMAMQGLLNNGNEILIPAPDYPLWTAAVKLAGGKAVHYRCDEQSDWFPDIADIEKKITVHTKGIVVINPNNPTGAVYSPDLLQKIITIARKHNLIIFTDEIYDKILYDHAVHTPMAALADDILIVTFNGLSKAYRAAGYRVGWMILSGNKDDAAGYIEGLEILSSMRLCSNVPAQFTVQTALGGYQSIYDLTKPGGRLMEQRDYVWKRLSEIPGVSCVKPHGALYVFPKLDKKKFNMHDDQQFIFDLLIRERVLLVQGTGFNWFEPDHFRIVFLPRIDVLDTALSRIAKFLEGYKQ
jgi:alanine-synthesizing transaminase